MAKSARADDQQPGRTVTADKAAQEQRAAMEEPAVPPTGPPAATYDQPAVPDEAGPGVRHPDGSIAPDEDAEPIGTTRRYE